jgi:hypothetical protein
MIVSKLLRVKKVFTKKNGEKLIDLISSTFKFNSNGASLGPVLVLPDEAMRPDRLAERVYGNPERWDVLLKFNGVSNPFSLDSDTLLLAPADMVFDKMVGAPRIIPEKGGDLAKTNSEVTVKPKTKKDQKRLDSLKKKIKEITPPNVNLTGESNIKIVNGKVIFGSNISNSESLNKNNSLTRSRVESQIKNTNNF